MSCAEHGGGTYDEVFFRLNPDDRLRAMHLPVDQCALAASRRGGCAAIGVNCLAA
jgi:hypothetical protein